ncbi:succinate dehydrogenase [ubiquinone] cytochrome b small subunit 2-like isoform X1 [Danaus plexippus]|uniref:Succinate dehydrogenase [ubiquinone] cytochrome b small subunit n=2 Tax=Danaus plexippus TaxID=13037 RepID=A0A212FDM2_DANPL|nr:succinate dehydrogenase [ubiquinone] cytochrome b small subunit 2-like isoform X1 [Danaus plexippus]OWR51875.1 succinate dehydrogenase cytochrome B small subunit [Danaus plexippus plexippus]
MILSYLSRRQAKIATYVRYPTSIRIDPVLKSSTALSSTIQLNNCTTMKPIGSPFFNPIKPFSTTMVRLDDEKPHDHAKLWIIEKGTAAVMLVLIPFGLLIPNKLFDSILTILITAHSYWGMEAIMVEYVRVLLFGPTIPKVAMGVVYALTVLMMGGLFYLTFNDIGMCRAFWRIWRNMRKSKDAPRTPSGGKTC